MIKDKRGVILGILSLVSLIVYIITFVILRASDFNPYVGIPISIISSIFGIILGGASFWQSNIFPLQ